MAWCLLLRSCRLPGEAPGVSYANILTGGTAPSNPVNCVVVAGSAQAGAAPDPARGNHDRRERGEVAARLGGQASTAMSTRAGRMAGPRRPVRPVGIHAGFL